LGFGIWCLGFTILFVLLSTSIAAQTEWYKYPGNPVFEYGKSGEWDQAKIAHVVLFEDDQYHMWYEGWSSELGQTGIGYASSRDGINWIKHEANPVDFSFESEDWAYRYQSFDIIKKDSMYLMWFIGLDRIDTTGYVGYAWSNDGFSWTIHPEPVLKSGKEDEWDAKSIHESVKVLFDGKRYHMWYNAFGIIYPSPLRIGYATSDDGILWEKYPANPVLEVGEPGTWDDNAVDVHSVNFNGSYWEMWYDGFNLINTEVGYATSDDGFNWIKSPENPVLKIGELGSWDTWIARIPIVVSFDSIYRMWYFGHNNARGSIGYATTSVKEAMAWDTATINKPQRIIKVQVFNREEYIKVDSLAGILPELSGIELIDALNKLALAYSLNDSKKSFGFAEEAMSLAEKANYHEGKAMALYSIGNCQYVMDNYSDALFNQLSALRLFDSLDMQLELANLLSQIAGIHSYAGSHDLACRYHKQALDVFEGQHDTGHIMHSLVYLGYTNLWYGDTASAISAFQRRLSLAKAINDKWRQVDSYEALGLCYSGRILDSALYYFNEANKIWYGMDTRDNEYTFLISAEACFAAGPQHYDEAEKLFLKTLAGTTRQNRVRTFYGMAELYFNTGRYDKTKGFLDISLHECKTFLYRQNHQMFTHLNQKLDSEMTLKPYMEKIYWLYYRLDTALQEKDLAFAHYKLATQWKDSLQNEQNRRQWAMMQGQYETETASNRIGILEKENEVQNLTIKQSRIYLFTMGGFVLIIVFMALLFIRQNKIRAEHKTVLLEQKMLRLQMNPHFIFNALSNIMNFIESKNTDKATRYLANFSSLLRSTLETTRKDNILLEEEVKGLTNYLELQKLRYGDKFEYAVDVDDMLDPEDVTIPPMLIQPFIENAIEHGIQHKESIGHINVRFILKGNQVICEVEDDGVGREKAWEVEYKTRRDHKSLATAIINDRIQAINKKMKQKIRLEIIDLKSEDNEPLGTKVVLGVPFSV